MRQDAFSLAAPGRIEVAEKSNELVAILKLLDSLVTEGAIVGTNAIGCQRDIGSNTMRVDSRLESLGGTLPLVR
jgi:predicted transposase YbfD/YdcC